ncbi:helix-turn-helix transcriptional regulator [Bacillus sp. JJ1503]|uniref:helix-turn-helix domain-containing protein n=1 Tax=Bacillus sp. JJ1503 TaxID=3122956 RepID=UPI002FFE776B
MYVFDFVKQEREKLGLTRQQLADKADVSIYVVKRIETNKPYNPSALKISKVAKAIGFDWDYLNDHCLWP